jgi:hypothetical protein
MFWTEYTVQSLLKKSLREWFLLHTEQGVQQLHVTTNPNQFKAFH